MHLHSTLAVNTDGLPLGVLRTRIDAPAPKELAAASSEDKKSFRWIESLRDYPGLKHAFNASSSALVDESGGFNGWPLRLCCSGVMAAFDSERTKRNNVYPRNVRCHFLMRRMPHIELRHQLCDRYVIMLGCHC